MSRYIDADAFDIVGYIVPHGMDFDSFEAGVNHVMNIIHNTPTADVVPMDFHNKVLEIEIKKQENLVDVVRCKDCFKKESCRAFNVWAVPPSDDWFCADGERREDDKGRNTTSI